MDKNELKLWDGSFKKNEKNPKHEDIIFNPNKLDFDDSFQVVYKTAASDATDYFTLSLDDGKEYKLDIENKNMKKIVKEILGNNNG